MTMAAHQFTYPKVTPIVPSAPRPPSAGGAASDAAGTDDR